MRKCRDQETKGTCMRHKHNPRIPRRRAHVSSTAQWQICSFNQGMTITRSVGTASAAGAFDQSLCNSLELPQDILPFYTLVPSQALSSLLTHPGWAPTPFFILLPAQNCGPVSRHILRNTPEWVVAQSHLFVTNKVVLGTNFQSSTTLSRKNGHLLF